MNPSASWLDSLAWTSLTVSAACAIAVLVDVFGARRRQRMRIMEWVWPITCLYAGPWGLAAYATWGRADRPDQAPSSQEQRPAWVGTSLAVSHCGAGCTIGDIVAEWTVFALGLTVAGRALWASMIGDYVLAVAFGLAFQYFAIAPMRDVSVREGIWAAAKADVLSLTAFEVGLFGWMAWQVLVLYPAPHALHPDQPGYWLGMQIGMCLGFVTAYPVNVWLIRRGIKERM